MFKKVGEQSSPGVRSPERIQLTKNHEAKGLRRKVILRI
jgi:hypothetical protein